MNIERWVNEYEIDHYNKPWSNRPFTRSGLNQNPTLSNTLSTTKLSLCCSFEDLIPTQPGEYIFFQDPHRPSRFGLVEWECHRWFITVIEFRQHELTVLCRDRAGAYIHDIPVQQVHSAGKKEMPQQREPVYVLQRRFCCAGAFVTSPREKILGNRVCCKVSLLTHIPRIVRSDNGLCFDEVRCRLWRNGMVQIEFWSPSDHYRKHLFFVKQDFIRPSVDLNGICTKMSFDMDSFLDHFRQGFAYSTPKNDTRPR